MAAQGGFYARDATGSPAKRNFAVATQLRGLATRKRVRCPLDRDYSSTPPRAYATSRFASAAVATRRHLFQQTFAKIRAGLPSLTERLASITCPALVVRGAESDVLSNADAERFADALRNGHSATIPNAGHTVHGDNSRGLARAFKQFLAAAA